MTPEGQTFMERLRAEEGYLSKDDELDRIRLSMEKREPIAHDLMAKDPELSYMSAFVIAGDLVSLQRSKDWVAQGCPAIDALPFVGSYGRFEFGVWAVENGHMELDLLLDMLPDLWRGADPDDTDPRYLSLWKTAWYRNGKKAVRDGPALPRSKTLTVFRGQDRGAPLGIAWSLDRAIAEKFAHGAGTRQRSRLGSVFESKVPRSSVLAYLTQRGESEVILPTIGTDYATVEVTA